MDSIKVYTLTETADLLKMSRPTLYGYVQKGEISGVKLGRDWRFTEDQIKEFLDKRTIKAK